MLHIYRHGVDVAQSLRYRGRRDMKRSAMQELYYKLKFAHSFMPKQGKFIDSVRCDSLEGGLSFGRNISLNRAATCAIWGPRTGATLRGLSFRAGTGVAGNRGLLRASRGRGQRSCGGRADQERPRLCLPQQRRTEGICGESGPATGVAELSVTCNREAIARYRDCRVRLTGQGREAIIVPSSRLSAPCGNVGGCGKIPSAMAQEPADNAKSRQRKSA